ncbi:MAG: GvpL/GvpF family gas vesicle protein [Pikeienuella sp.]
MAHYLHALLLGDDVGAGPRLAALPKGALGQPRLELFAGISTVVSTPDATEILPVRRNLMAHMRVIEHLAPRHPGVPVRFGQVFPDKRALGETITRNAAAIRSEITRLSGFIEFALRVTIERQAAIAQLAAANPTLRKAYMAASTSVDGHRRRIELGRRVSELLAETRAASERSLLAALREVATDLRPEPPSEDVELLRVSLLVERGKEAALEGVISQAVNRLDWGDAKTIAVKLVGPTLPGSFVTLDLAAGAASAA